MGNKFHEFAFACSRDKPPLIVWTDFSLAKTKDLFYMVETTLSLNRNFKESFPTFHQGHSGLNLIVFGSHYSGDNTINSYIQNKPFNVWHVCTYKSPRSVPPVACEFGPPTRREDRKMILLTENEYLYAFQVDSKNRSFSDNVAGVKVQLCFQQKDKVSDCILGAWCLLTALFHFPHVTCREIIRGSEAVKLLIHDLIIL